MKFLIRYLYFGAKDVQIAVWKWNEKINFLYSFTASEAPMNGLHFDFDKIRQCRNLKEMHDAKN